MNMIAKVGAGGEDLTCIAPAEFVRLRYFFGQRLGVIDFVDEQSYVVGKLRLHNRLAHGVGVLCGLQATRFIYPQNAPAGSQTTLLRVSSGVALDPFGREIVVGWDQCIDVAAWYQQNPAAKPAAGPDIKLWVALCYRECPSDPAPAPRDPCGCEPGGCDYARVREGFELKLITDAEVAQLKPSAPASGLSFSALEVLSGSTATALAEDVALAAGAACPVGPADPCLLLAAFKATLSADLSAVVDIGNPDNHVRPRLSLLSTGALQQGLVDALAAAADGGLTGDGPQLGTVSFTATGADTGTLSIALDPDADLSTDPFAPPLQLTVRIAQFKDNGTWGTADKPPATYVATSPRHIELTLTGLADGNRYRVTIANDPYRPVVNTTMEPLRPPLWARHFRLITDGSGNLSLANSLY